MPESLRRQIEQDFSSVEATKAHFEEAAAAQFSSGWVFLVVDPAGQRLEIITLPNRDRVLLHRKPGLLASDLWEHTYYLTYRDRRADWLKAWRDVVQ